MSADKRTGLMPNVPTTIEAGLPANSVYPFYTGTYLPAKTPHNIVEKLSGEIGRALREPAVQARLVTLGVEPMPMSQEQFAKFLKEDVEANLALVKAAGIPTQ